MGTKLKCKLTPSHCVVAAMSCLISAGFGLATLPAQAGERLVMAATGGSYQAIMEEHVFDPFTEETGIEVVFVSGALGERWAKIQAMTDAGNFEWDLMEGGSADVFDPEKQAYLEDLGENCAQVPRAFSDGAPATCHRYGVLTVLGATLLTANTDSFEGGAVPSNWAEFWDVENFPGPRALQNFGTPWRVLVGALAADGVPLDEIFPLDLDRAFRKLDEIRPHITVWWNSGDQIQRAFREGEVVAGLIWGTRLGFLQKEGIPLVPIWNGATLNAPHWLVFKDGPNKDNALKFLNWYFDNPKAQHAFAVAGNLAPSTKSAVEFFSPEEQVQQPTHPDNIDGIIPVDPVWLAEHRDEMLERWNAWLAQ